MHVQWFLKKTKTWNFTLNLEQIGHRKTKTINLKRIIILKIGLISRIDKLKTFIKLGTIGHTKFMAFE
jgi:hypothetical protein